MSEYMNSIGSPCTPSDCIGTAKVENTRGNGPRLDLDGPLWTWHYFPMQKVLKIRLRMSSFVVAPVISSRGRSAL